MMHVPLDDFADPEFIALNKSFFDKYISLRVQGHDQRTAFLRVFGIEHLPQDAQGQQRRLEAIESTDYFNTHFNAALEAIKVSDMWNPKRALNELLCVVRGPYVKDSTKLNAIKELNIMVGIVIVDENGKTKAGRSLADFYDSVDGDSGAKDSARNAA
jgi:hypothetical protein